MSARTTRSTIAPHPRQEMGRDAEGTSSHGFSTRPAPQLSPWAHVPWLRSDGGERAHVAPDGSRGSSDPSTAPLSTGLPADRMVSDCTGSSLMASAPELATLDTFPFYSISPHPPVGLPWPPPPDPGKNSSGRRTAFLGDSRPTCLSRAWKGAQEGLQKAFRGLLRAHHHGTDERRPGRQAPRPRRPRRCAPGSAGAGRRLQQLGPAAGPGNRPSFPTRCATAAGLLAILVQ
jgi:hypothetical protein